MLEENGVHLAAISYDSQEILRDFTENHKIHYPLLSDRDSTVIRAFGIFNYNMAPDLRSYGVPHPGEYLVAPDGIIIRKYFVENYQHRVTGSAVALREFGAQAANAVTTVLSGGPVTVQVIFPSPTAFAGQELSFLAKFHLDPGWHIYGNPLPPGYTATSLLIEDPRVLRQSFQFPPPQILHLPALDETLQVYSGVFEGIGSVLLKFPLPNGELALAGRLSFQACSDSTCEVPVEIAFTLAIQLKPFKAV